MYNNSQELRDHWDNLNSKAEGRWIDILKSAGISAVAFNGKHQGCPLCGGEKRFRYVNKQHSRYYEAYVCNDCTNAEYRSSHDLLAKYLGGGSPDWKAANEHLEEYLGIPPPFGRDESAPKTERKPVILPPPVPKIIKPVDNTERIKLWWRQAKKEHELLEAYVEHRGLQPIQWPLNDVRLHPGLELWSGKEFLGIFPAMLTLAKSTLDGKCHGVHRTYMTQDGKKLKFPDPDIKTKLFYKARDELPPTSIQLWKPNNLLGVCEGIETAWGVHELYDIPVWAARDTHNLGLFTPPPGIDELLIFIDTDPPKLNPQGQQVGLAGQRHGEILLKRMTDAGVKARIMEIPLSKRITVAKEIGESPDKLDWLHVAMHKNLRKSWTTVAMAC